MNGRFYSNTETSTMNMHICINTEQTKSAHYLHITANYLNTTLQLVQGRIPYCWIWDTPHTTQNTISDGMQKPLFSYCSK